jgi:hypothetical protein
MVLTQSLAEKYFGKNKNACRENRSKAVTAMFIK